MRLVRQETGRRVAHCAEIPLRCYSIPSQMQRRVGSFGETRKRFRTKSQKARSVAVEAAAPTQRVLVQFLRTSDKTTLSGGRGGRAGISGDSNELCTPRSMRDGGSFRRPIAARIDVWASEQFRV
jgi:hypothetical protein